MTSTDVKAEALVKEGAALYSQGELERALLRWKEALALDPTNAAAIEYLKFIESHFKVSVDTLLERYAASQQGGEQPAEVSAQEVEEIGAQPTPSLTTQHSEGAALPEEALPEAALPEAASEAPPEIVEAAGVEAVEGAAEASASAEGGSVEKEPSVVEVADVEPDQDSGEEQSAEDALEHASDDQQSPSEEIAVEVDEASASEPLAEPALGIIETEAEFESLDWSAMLDQSDEESLDIQIPETISDPMSRPAAEFATPMAAEDVEVVPPPPPAAPEALAPAQVAPAQVAPPQGAPAQAAAPSSADEVPEDSVWGQVEIEYGQAGGSMASTPAPADAVTAAALGDLQGNGQPGARGEEVAWGEVEWEGAGPTPMGQMPEEPEPIVDTTDELSALFAPAAVEGPGEGSVDDPFVDTAWANILPRTPSPGSSEVHQTLDGPFGIKANTQGLSGEDSGPTDVIADISAGAQDRSRALVEPPPAPEPLAVVDVDELPSGVTGSASELPLELPLEQSPPGVHLNGVNGVNGGAASPEPGSAEALNVMAQQMDALHAAGDFSGALELADRLLMQCPGHPRAERYLTEHADQLQAVFKVRLGPLDHCPKVLMGPDQIIWQSMDHRAGFLFSQADGLTPYEDIIAISGMSELEATRLLVQLVDLNVIG
ncbi:MAG: tetratricopeptide repeat protein [Bradymonadia bacterium]